VVIKHSSILARLKELDTVLSELKQYQEIQPETLRAKISQRWIVERGLIAAATLILDIADHILVGHLVSMPKATKKVCWAYVTKMSSPLPYSIKSRD
jgi:hypothetical protein